MEPRTIVIDKFNGRITRYRDGDINSGMCVQTSTAVAWGYDAQQQSGILSFNQAPYSIAGSVVTDLVVVGEIRVESGISYVYAVGHLGRIYKIQVNNPATKNPDYDNPVLLTTLANGQTFKYAASIEFYTLSGVEYIWIGHDTGVTRVNFDGTGETVIGTTSSSTWISNVPRQSQQFLGSIFYTNGANLAQIDSTGLVATYQKLSPGFPSNTTARDLDVTSDGRYIVTVVNPTPPGDQTVVAVDTSTATSTTSLLVYWNGIDPGASSSITFNFPLTSYFTFSGFEYVFGEQIGGAMLGTPQGIINVLEFETSPTPNAVGSSGDYLGWASTRFIGGQTRMVFNLYGQIDNETPVGFYKQLLLPSTLTDGDVVRVPFMTPVSSWQPSGATSGYANQPFHLFGTGKTYFSTIEYDGSTTAYNLYAFKNVLDFQGVANTGNYQTQNQIFSKKIKPTEVRVYVEPFPATTSFTVDLIGIDGNAMTGGSKTFSYTEQDRGVVKFTPQSGGTPSIGVRITNAGVLTPFIHKVEIDVSPYGD